MQSNFSNPHSLQVGFHTLDLNLASCLTLIINVTPTTNEIQYIVLEKLTFGPLFQILPHNLSQYRGGKELQEQINNLTAKVDLAKAELAHERSGAGSTLSRMFDEIEKKQLLRPESKKTKNGSNGLKIDLESNLYSIRNPEFESRDKNVHPEFEQA